MEIGTNLSGGLYRDNDPSAQPPNTYSDALNGTLTSEGNNKWSYESVKGNKVSWTGASHNSSAKPFVPIGFGSFPDRLIVLSANDNGGDGTIGGDGLEQYAGEIGEVTFDNAGIGTYQMLYYHKDLLMTRDHPFPKDGIVCKPENAAIKRIYFTDNYQPFRNFNVVDSRIRNSDGTIKRVLNGDLVVGNTYMVLTSSSNNTSIVHGGNTYGPGHPRSNIFTAGSTGYTGSGWVVEYIPVESLAVTPAIMLGEIEVKRFTSGGNLLSGSYQYFYQLGTSDGAYTNYSYVTREVFVPGTAFPGTSGMAYQNYQGGASAVTSNKYITLTINGIDQNFDKIRVGYIYSSALGVYDSPKLFHESFITGESMSIDHYGSETVTTLSNDDLVVPLVSMDKVKSIASTKNLLFAANVGLANDPNYDMSSSVECETFAYEIPGDTAGNIDSASTIAAGYAPVGQPSCGNETTGNTFALPGQWYEVVSGSVIHNAVTYTTGQFFKTVLGNQVIDQATGPGVAVAVIRIGKYTSSSTLTAGNYKNIRILDDYCDYKGMLVSHYLKGHWRNETYRYGILLWHKNGFPLYVRFLCDKTFPAHWNVSADIDPDTGNAYGYDACMIDSTLYDATDDTTALRILGARFSNIDFQLVADELTELTGTTVTLSDLPDHVKGFSIVRCPLDAQVVSQGILYPTVYTGATNVYPVASNQLQNDVYGSLAQRQTYLYNYFSPEALFQFDGEPSVQSGDKLIIQDYFNVTDAGTEGIQIIAAFDARYCKHYVRQTGAPFDYTGATTTLYQKGSQALIIPGGTLAVANGATAVPIPSLSPKVFYNVAQESAGLGSDSGTGSKTVLVYAIGGDEATLTAGLGNHTAAGKHKAIVNWVRPKANLYGGTSEFAKANNQYMFTGHFQPLDDDFMTYMTGTTDGGGSKAAGIVNNVEVFGGDCFVTIYDAVRNIKDSSVADANAISYATVFPVETRVNPCLREGRHFAKDRFREDAGTEAPNGILYSATPANAQNETFTYLTGYSNVQSQMYYPAKPAGFVSNGRDENIVYFSLKKTDGELIDNFKRILLNNYQRSDSQYGAIYNIRAKSERLFYWQFKGVGYMPVQERTTISGSLGQSVQLGIGGVLERQDEVDFFYGNQHQDGLMEAETFFAWFDFRRRAMMQMGFGGQIRRVGDGLVSYFENLFSNIESEASPNIFDSENSVTGKGITSVYDPRFKIVLFTFRFNRTISGKTTPQDVTVAFDQSMSKVIGFFSFTPGIYCEHNGLLLMGKVSSVTIQNSTAYSLGEELFDTTTGKNYVCILAYTSGSPATIPSSDSTHWSVSSQINQIFVNWRGNICKFFGIVYPWYLETVIKVGQGQKIVVDNVSVDGNDTRFTDVYVSNSYNSAQDTNIASYNREYKYFDGAWNFTIPFASSRQRLVDTWMKLKMVVKNYTGTAVTTSNDAVKRIFSIKSEIRGKN